MLEDMTGYDSSSHVRAELEGIKVVFPSDRVGLLRGRGFILNRTEWLRGIAHKLGTLRVYLNEKVGDVSDLNGDIVVGADGPWSVVRRHVGGRAEIRNVHQKRVECEMPKRPMQVENYLGERSPDGGDSAGGKTVAPGSGPPAHEVVA